LKTKGNKNHNHLYFLFINRVEKYDRDLSRWQFMDEQSKREDERLNAMNEKYLTGRKNKGGSAYNILSL
jgi:hypothetical protein